MRVEERAVPFAQTAAHAGRRPHLAQAKARSGQAAEACALRSVRAPLRKGRLISAVCLVSTQLCIVQTLTQSQLMASHPAAAACYCGHPRAAAPTAWHPRLARWTARHAAPSWLGRRAPLPPPPCCRRHHCHLAPRPPRRRCRRRSRAPRAAGPPRPSAAAAAAAQRVRARAAAGAQS